MEVALNCSGPKAKVERSTAHTDRGIAKGTRGMPYSPTKDSSKFPGAQESTYAETWYEEFRAQ